MMRVQCRDRWLNVDFKEPQHCLSWAVVGGGNTISTSVVWHQVQNQDLLPGEDPAELFSRRHLERGGTLPTVGLLTSAKIDNYALVKQRRGGLEVQCLATVGMGNALRIGDHPSRGRSFGTINILLATSLPLSAMARVEAVSMVSEARTVAVLKHQLLSPISLQPATGTGTDCVVVAHPLIGRELEYCGKHTQVGHLLGEAVIAAVDQGIEKWKTRRNESPHWMVRS